MYFRLWEPLFSLYRIQRPAPKSPMAWELPPSRVCGQGTEGASPQPAPPALSTVLAALFTQPFANGYVSERQPDNPGLG